MKDPIITCMEERKCLIEDKLKKQQYRLNKLAGYEAVTLEVSYRKNGNVYYRIRDRKKSSLAGNGKVNKRLSKPRYVGNASEAEVKKIKYAHFLDKSQSILSNNLKLINSFLEKYEECDDLSILEKLPNTYSESLIIENRAMLTDKAKLWKQNMRHIKNQHPVIHPEGLIHTALDGTKLRSKSELNIHNFFLSENLIFEYEVPIETDTGVTLWPDFVILSEFDYETIIMIEHQGMMDDEEYCRNFGKKVKRYLDADYKIGKDVFFTFDDKNHGIDMRDFQEILKKVRSRQQSSA